jgi:hypothetical protein
MIVYTAAILNQSASLPSGVVYENQYELLTDQVEGSKRILLVLRVDPLTNKIVVELATTASYVNSSSYSQKASTSNIANTASYYAGSVVSSSYALSSSYAQQANSASYTTLANTSSYVANTVSASYVPNLYPQIPQTTVPSASWISASAFITTAQTASYVANLYPQVQQTTVPSASWISASVKITTADTASYVPNLYPQILQTTVASASWVSASVRITTADSASYQPYPNISTTGSNTNYPIPFVFNSGSSNPIYMDWTASHITFNPSINTLTVASTVTTASWATNAISSSYYAGSVVSSSYALTSSFSSQTQFTGSYTGSFFGPAAAFAWGNWSVNGVTVTNNQSYNSTVARQSVGIYTFKFTTASSKTSYAIVMNAASASTNALYNAGPTGSICTPFNLGTIGFTASFAPASASLAKNDPTSGSFVVFSY